MALYESALASGNVPLTYGKYLKYSISERISRSSTPPYDPRFYRTILFTKDQINSSGSIADMAIYSGALQQVTLLNSSVSMVIDVGTNSDDSPMKISYISGSLHGDGNNDTYTANISIVFVKGDGTTYGVKSASIAPAQPRDSVSASVPDDCRYVLVRMSGSIHNIDLTGVTGSVSVSVVPRNN